jgi:Secretion system C-terminal sorting domain/Viral BACON domain
MKYVFYRFCLALAFLLPIALHAQVQTCADLSEPNNNMGQAFDLGNLSDSIRLDSLCLSAGDHDFFKFNHIGTLYYVRVRGFSSSTQGQYGLKIRLDSNFLTVNTHAVNGSRTDTYLYLSDGNSVTLGENDDANRTLFSEVRYNFINPVVLSVNPTQLSLSATGDSTAFVVTAANTNWTLVAPSWLTVSATTGGSGATTVRVLAAANTTLRERLGYIAIVGSNNQRRGVWVTQAAAPFVCNDAFEPNNSMQQFTNLGVIATTWQDSSLCLAPASDQDFFAINVNNVNYFVRVKGYSFNTVGRYGLRVNYQQNIITLATFARATGENTDTYLYLMNANGDVLAQNDDFGGTFYSQIVYNTSITPSLSVTPSTLNLSAANGRSVISVQATMQWAISGLPTWLTVSPMLGGVGLTNVSVIATNNLDTASRQAVFMVSGGGQSMVVTVRQQGNTLANLMCTDRFEPNNAVLQATTLNNLGSITLFRDSSLCLTAGDEDFFRFTIDSTQYIARIRAFAAGANFLGRYGLNIQRATGSFTVSTFSTAGSTADTYLYVMNNTGTIILGQNDDISGTTNRFSSVTISTAPVARPNNDEPCGAIALIDTATFVGNLTGATLTAYPSPTIAITGASCPTNTKDVWYTTVVPASGVVTIRTTAGTLRDAIMAIYRGNNCDSIIEPVLACEDDNRDGNGSFMPVLTVQQPAGTRLYIRVWSFGTTTGTFNIMALPFATPNVIGGNPADNGTTAKISQDQINAYPNPASSTLTVDLKSSVAQKNVPITLIDALGRVVLTDEKTVLEGYNSFEIDVNRITDGMYFLRVGNQSIRLQILHQ